MRSIIFVSLIGLALSAETRVKVGSKRWAFNIETNEGKNVRKEYTDESGVAFGTFTFVGTDEATRQLQYKFDLNGEEPDISFGVANVAKQEENGPNSDNIETTDKSVSDNTNNNTNSSLSSLTSVEPNYESIDGGEDFSGHVSLKVGKSVYFINFLSGDKTAAREEAYDENGLIYGKYTYFNEPKQSKIVVNYKFNSTGNDPTFEVSMYKKSEPNRANPVENESNVNNYYSPNRVNRRILVPSQPYNRANRQMPSVTLQNTNPPHNIITPMSGNWYYRLQ